MESKSIEEVYNEQLRVNIVSLYDGYESTIKDLSRLFEIPERQVRGFIEEEEVLMQKKYGEEKGGGW